MNWVFCYSHEPNKNKSRILKQPPGQSRKNQGPRWEI
uniref:Uncharacterized protein n=1 Tax=Rhizophora mucronata TaxID=61149 RepID=A0A2P2K6G4_RHIMU